MSSPVRPETPPPHEYLMYLRDTGQHALADEYEQYLRETGQEQMIGLANRQREFLSGRMERRVARENLNEREMLEAEQAMDRERSGLRGAATRGLGAATSLIRDIPGAEAAAAGVRAVARGQPYAEALGDIREAGEQVNPVVRGVNRFVGGGMAGAAIPGSPAMSGAAYGGLLNLLGADPDQSLTERGVKAGAGAAVGGALGKVADVVGTGIRAFNARPIEQQIRQLEAARSASSGPLYRAAMQEGAEVAGGFPVRTPQMQEFLQSPDIQAITQNLRGLREFADVAPDDPRMLDAIYKVLSDQQKAVGKQLAVNDPSRPNLGRFTGRDIGAAKQQALEAMSGPSGPMPSYATAVDEFARGSRQIDAAKRGYQAMRTASSAGGSPENLVKRGPESLIDWLREVGPEYTPQAVEGALGSIRRNVGAAGPTGLLNPLRTIGRNALFDGGAVLRQIEATAEPTVRRTLLDFLQDAAIAGATPALGSSQ